MPELIRTRDCVVFYKGDAYPVAVSPQMRQGGWPGMQGVQWFDAPTDEFAVTYSSGLYGGFLLWGSNESSDLYTTMTGQQVAYGYGILCAGGWLLSTSTYERYTWASRVAHQLNPLVPLVPLVYQGGSRLVFSLRGYLTPEDEWLLSGDPRGSNEFYMASVVQVPSSTTNQYLTVQTSI